MQDDKFQVILERFTDDLNQPAGLPPPVSLPNKTDFDRFAGSDLTPEQLETLKEKAVWGTYGPNGNEPLKYVPFRDLETDHLENILVNLPTHPALRRLIVHLLKERYTTR